MTKRTRVAVVTGGNRGIGLEVCRELGRRGLTVVLTSRDRERGESEAARLVTDGLDVRPRQLDTTDPAGARDLAAWLDRELGGADVLVNNAAILLEEDGDVLRIPEGAFRDSFETNVMGPLRLCQALVPGMRPPLRPGGERLLGSGTARDHGWLCAGLLRVEGGPQCRHPPGGPCGP